jgi:EAL domain-containing protein (putative c-di-GMP-specific phosphodiesterase class I)
VEGVETQAQLRALTALSCDFVQGYFLSRRVRDESVTRLIEQIAAPPRAELVTDAAPQQISLRLV